MAFHVVVLYFDEYPSRLMFRSFSQPQRYVVQVQMRQQGSVNGQEAGNGGGNLTLSVHVRSESERYWANWS